VGEIRVVAVISAGALGRGIAHVAALGGYRTILEDILPASLRSAEDELRELLAQAIAGGKLSAGDANSALRRLEYAGSVEQAARQADLVIEAVPDETDSKLEIVTLLDKICRPHTIVACNSSTLSVSEIASVTYRAAGMLGMRFRHPVAEMKVLEIVRGRETSDQTAAAGAEVARRMGMEAVVVREDLAEDV
jgi:3-hydroxybutyryl-CoA dehydrogenase